MSIIIDKEKIEKAANKLCDYGLLKAEEEMKADHKITERWLDNCGMWLYEFKYYNANGVLLSLWFNSKTRIMAFIQHENEVMNLTAEMQDITQKLICFT